jgi:hypothetical protein
MLLRDARDFEKVFSISLLVGCKLAALKARYKFFSSLLPAQTTIFSPEQKDPCS